MLNSLFLLTKQAGDQADQDEQRETQGQFGEQYAL